MSKVRFSTTAPKARKINVNAISMKRLPKVTAAVQSKQNRFGGFITRDMFSFEAVPGNTPIEVYVWTGTRGGEPTFKKMSFLKSFLKVVSVIDDNR